jgi:hypothetical protein
MNVISKNRFLPKHQLYACLCLWFIINLIQAIFTEINPDEAYYAFWAEHLSFGYYDHPPMVAIIIYISSLISKGNLGVRLITLILQPITLLITWQLSDTGDMPYQKRLKVFFYSAAAMTMLAAYGFITTPDVPLLFFTALFLLAYKKFTLNNNLFNTLLLAIAMSGLVYSKYQGVIIIILVFISNLRLISNPRFLIAGVLSLLLCLPHFAWQINNNFPSFQYHLVERSKSFKWNYFFEYIPNQLATFGPFVFAAMVWIVVKYKVSNLFERSLLFVITGMILFFWMVTYRGHAEPHWTVAASIPAIVLIVNFSSVNERFFHYIRRFVGASIILIVLARIALMTDILPEKIGFSGKKAKYNAINSVAKNTPVVFSGSFQSPSLYHFFTGNTTTVISSLYSRQTQYDIWRLDRGLQGKKVFVAGQFDNRTNEYRINNQVLNGFFVDSFQTTHDIRINFQETKKKYSSGERVTLLLDIENKGPNYFLFPHSEMPASLTAIVLNKNGFNIIDGALSEPIAKLSSGEKKKVVFSFLLPKINPGEYSFGLGCSSLLGPTLNSVFSKITILP